MALRIRDKANYYVVVPFFWYVAVYKVVDGQVCSSPIAYENVGLDDAEPQQWYIKVAGSDLDVWVNVDNASPANWVHAIDSTSGGYNSGDNILTDISSGGVGLANLPAGTSLACDYIRIGADGNADHDLADANEAVIDDSFSSVQVSLAYDDNGNLTDDGLYVYKYDPWNRLVQVKRKGGPQPTVAEYTYDGLGRRIKKVVTNSGDREREEYFYYAGWQLLEVRSGSDVAVRQFVWGTTYIDEAICMNVDTDADGSCIEDGGSVRYLYMQDANWNVVRVWSDNVWTGTSTERYEYDPYGLTRILAGYNSSEGHEDLNVVGASQLAAPNPIRYAGYYFDDETGLYHVRNRMYSPALQRWTQRDPGLARTAPPFALGVLAQYADGANLYAYVSNNTMIYHDPSGGIKCVHGETFLNCMKQVDKDYQQRLAFAQAIYDKCLGTVNRWLDLCLLDCKELCFPLRPICYAGCLGGSSLLAAGCLAAYEGALAGAHLAYIAEGEGCLIGATMEFRDATTCPEGWFPR